MKSTDPSPAHTSPYSVYQGYTVVEYRRPRSTRFRFTQVITNFINNAVKFTRKGYIKLGYEYKEKEGYVYIYVEDTGIGIAKEALEKVFERFYKQDEFAQGTDWVLPSAKQLPNAWTGIS